MKKSMLFVLSVSAGLCAAGALRADNSVSGSAPGASSNASVSGANPAASAATQSVANTNPAAASVADAVAANDAPGSLKQGKDLLDAGKYADAVNYLNGIGKQVADNGLSKREPFRLLDLSTAYIGLGQYSNAEAAANAALALKPDLEGAWNDLGSAQVNGGDRAGAIATYAKGIDTLTKSGDDHARLDGNLQALQAASGAQSDSAAPATAVPAAAGGPANAAATVGN